MKSEDVQDVLLSLSLKLIVNKQEWTLLVGCKEHFFLCRNVLLPEEYSFVSFCILNLNIFTFRPLITFQITCSFYCLLTDYLTTIDNLIKIRLVRVRPLHYDRQAYRRGAD